MRRAVLFCLVVAMLLVAGSASAQWTLGMRLVGTGNYFPYLPFVQLMTEGETPGIFLSDAGIYGYKELAVGYTADKLSYEVNFAFDRFGGTMEDTDGDVENTLTWWYVGGAIFYGFLQGESYDGRIGFRYQYGTSELSHIEPLSPIRADVEYTLSGNTSQFSVPLRFMWHPGGGRFGIGPEVAFKYSTGTTEYKIEAEGDSQSTDGPEYTGFDTEYSLMMEFMF